MATAKEPKDNGMVKITIPRVIGDKNNSMTVGLNGVMYTVKRGVEVEVPLGVAEIIQNSIKQDMIVMDLLDELENDYSESN